METTDALRALAALAQDTRLAVFRFLVERGPAGAHVGEIAEALGLAPATLSFHLKHLAGAGLVRTEPRGRHIRCEADFQAMRALVGYLTDTCCAGRPELCLPVESGAQCGQGTAPLPRARAGGEGA